MTPAAPVGSTGPRPRRSPVLLVSLLFVVNWLLIRSAGLPALWLLPYVGEQSLGTKFALVFALLGLVAVVSSLGLAGLLVGRLDPERGPLLAPRAFAVTTGAFTLGSAVLGARVLVPLLSSHASPWIRLTHPVALLSPALLGSAAALWTWARARSHVG